MKKKRIGDRLRYRFDNLMAKGTIAMVVILFLITTIVVGLTGFFGSIFNPEYNVIKTIWMSFMHALDAGTLAGADLSNFGYVVVMTIVTMCGIFVTSILIGIISAGFEEKFNDLKKGTSKVIEKGHTVIIGFNDSIYTIITELIEAGENQKRSCIIVLGNEEKEEMEELIKGHIKNFKNTKVICRSGKLTESYLYERAALEDSKSIIINQEEDFSVIKIILSVVNYLKSKDSFYNNSLHFTSMIYEKENLDAAKIAGEGKAEIIYFKDALSRIIAHTCREPGLSIVLTEFFDYGGDEFYFENFEETYDKEFGDVLNMFEESVVVGLKKGEEVLLNPPMNTVIEKDDCIIHLAKDDDLSKPSLNIPDIDLSIESDIEKAERREFHLLILGYNHYLKKILREIDSYSTPGSTVTIAGKDLPQNIKTNYKNIKVSTKISNIYKREELEKIIKNDTKDILLLSDLDVSSDESDSKTLLLLIHLRDMSSTSNRKFNITSEMRAESNQKIAKVTDVNDFVVGSSITNLILAQISENRGLSVLFEDLLDEKGSELYMKKANLYVKPYLETDFYTLTEIGKKRSEIVVGYKKNDNDKMLIVTNPKKADKIIFTPDDYLVVIAEEA